MPGIAHQNAHSYNLKDFFVQILTSTKRNMSSPYISIVIPTLNEEKNIGPLMRGIKHVLGENNYEVIIVDGHSEDETVRIATSYNASILYDDISVSMPNPSSLRLSFPNTPFLKLLYP